ncbi:MAG: helix-turn-helix domain-containing protein [Sporichthyaceae bacterium]
MTTPHSSRPSGPHLPRQRTTSHCERPQSPATEPGVYTVDEVAAILGIARCVAYACVRDGSIPARRIGRRWVISRVAFHAWLDGAAPGGS